MSKRSLASIGVALCGALLASHYFFILDLGGFIWGVAFMAIIFAAIVVTTPSDKDTSNG